MNTVLEFLATNAAAITIALLVLASIANAATRHFSEHTGAAKVLAFIAEMFSILASRGANINGTPSKIKLPGQSVPPTVAK
jgi:hypothetical protein